MAKKKDKKKGKKELDVRKIERKKIKEFNNLLEENQKHIIIMKDEKEHTLKELTEETVEEIKSVPFDSVPPVSTDEILKSKATVFGVDTGFSGSVFKLYESATKTNIRNTLILNYNVDEVDEIFSMERHDIKVLFSKTNLQMIVSDMQRTKKKLDKWCQNECEEDYDMFVIHIPGVVFFKDKILNDKPSNAVFVDVLIQVVKTKSKWEKVMKKRASTKEVNAFVAKCTIETIKNLGISFPLINVDSFYGDDSYDKVDIVSDYYLMSQDEVARKIINKVQLVSENSTTYSILATRVFDEFSAIKS